ncbi:MAG: biotin/lipoyl-binding protein [Burkholderiales bacterium]|nr:biotin/lipoyl-binding protein [Burkholderiales bacterium]
MTASYPFDTVLIANRGEIALRIMRTAQALGYRTVAVYSDADAQSMHAQAADTAVHIGASSPAASYLNIPAVITAALQSGAQAIHPGYGFLAENAAFATACHEAGLVFIGPSAAAMLAMGNKAGGKQRMLDAGVPCVPGYHGKDQSDARMRDEAERIGFPVMIKAVAGGGGRGMRCVTDAGAFLEALASARSEAENAFSSSELILEKALVEPRHIEVQIFADKHGNVVHLGERDCSVQRRHQKLIEESPSPAVTPELRARMGQVAVAAAKAIEYVGAGTLEFLLDRNGHFYFMEMNTRLQVEHAVTEAITGIDLVEWQLRIASGEALPLTQSEIDARREQGGHAIEVRLCAEDPELNFLPQSGRVALWRAPPALRTDHALRDGSDVSPFYDSMLAKIVGHGKDRADALRRLARGLDDCVLLGMKSNRTFLAQCLRQKEFADGDFDTAFIDKHFPAERRTPIAADRSAQIFAAVLLARRRSRVRDTRFPEELRGWCSGDRYPQAMRFSVNGVLHDAHVCAQNNDVWEVQLADELAQVRVGTVHDTFVVLQYQAKTYRLDFVSDANAHNGACYFQFSGRDFTAQEFSYTAPQRSGSASLGGRVISPMNGRLVAVHVSQGERVQAGQLLMAIEAMKMEHSVVTTVNGTVQSVLAALGDQVAPGSVLIEIEEEK